MSEKRTIPEGPGFQGLTDDQKKGVDQLERVFKMAEEKGAQLTTDKMNQLILSWAKYRKSTGDQRELFRAEIRSIFQSTPPEEIEAALDRIDESANGNEDIRIPPLEPGEPGGEHVTRPNTGPLEQFLDKNAKAPFESEADTMKTWDESVDDDFPVR